MTEYFVWDRFIRIFHITLAVGFFLNAIMTEDISLLHNGIGYALVGLIGVRLVWGILGPRPARLTRLFKGKAAIRDQISDITHHRGRTHLDHSPLGGLMVANLLGTILAICMSGIFLTYPTPPSWLEGAHEAFVVWAKLSIAIHILAVFWESLRTKINLVAAMISGRKRIPDTIDIVE